VILPHPKNTGNGRYTYLAAWGFALVSPAATTAAAQDFVARLLQNAPLFAAGGRDATTTFMQRDRRCPVSFESEAELIAREFGKGEFAVVYPSLSILTEFPVAIVNPVVDKKGTRKLAQAYLEYLWSPDGPGKRGAELSAAAKPGDPEEVCRAVSARRTFTVDEVSAAGPRPSGALQGRRHLRPDLSEEVGALPLAAWWHRLMRRRLLPGRLLPGFRPVAGLYPVLYLSLLDPAAAFRSGRSGPVTWARPSSGRSPRGERALASYRVTFGASLLAATINAVLWSDRRLDSRALLVSRQTCH
jgi:hypothetical protein